MEENIASISLVFIEIFCSKIFLETFGICRFSGLKRIIQIFALGIFTVINAFLFSNQILLRQILFIILFSFFTVWYISVNLVKSVILAFLYDALLLVMDYLICTFDTQLFLTQNVSAEYSDLRNYFLALFSKLTLFLIIMFIRKRFANGNVNVLGDYEWLRFLFFPLFTISVIFIIIRTFSASISMQEITILMYIAFGLAGMNIIVFYLINDIVNRELQLRDTKLFHLQRSAQTEMYQAISENFEKQKRKTHEYKNEILCIEKLLSTQSYNKLQDYVQNIFGKLNKELDAIDTNNIIINAILNTKYQEAVDKGIVFVFSINDLSKLKISDEDIVTLLSNLLNNAIEACEECTEKKVIKLKFIIEEDGKTIISVRNTYCGRIQYQNGEIISSKMDVHNEHGVGIKNILKIIDRYHGDYVVQHDNNEFYFAIVIK